ncbi:MAG: hypothetical protein GY699_23230 [Desulfobacteraceae bacterium]|nr:hypothetical protein [Desulfobacteraceae bacterium]
MKMAARRIAIWSMIGLLTATNATAGIQGMGPVQESGHEQEIRQVLGVEGIEQEFVPIGGHGSLLFLLQMRMLCQTYNLDIEDYYNSVVPTEVWLANHGLNASLLLGVSLSAIFLFHNSLLKGLNRLDSRQAKQDPTLGHSGWIGVSVSHLEGEPDGTFNTQEISPAPEGPYSGRVEYDYDQWDIAVDFGLTKSFYGRLEYSTWEMDGSWVYTSVVTPDEPQEYEFDSYSVGLGFKKDLMAIGKSKYDSERRFGLVLDLFAGGTYFELEHTEKTANLTYKTDGIGYKLSADLMATYNLGLIGSSNLYLFAGAGYGYETSKKDNLDMSSDGFSGKIGLEISF